MCSKFLYGTYGKMKVRVRSFSCQIKPGYVWSCFRTYPPKTLCGVEAAVVVIVVLLFYRSICDRSSSVTVIMAMAVK